MKTVLPQFLNPRGDYASPSNAAVIVSYSLIGGTPAPGTTPFFDSFFLLGVADAIPLAGTPSGAYTEVIVPETSAWLFGGLVIVVLARGYAARIERAAADGYEAAPIDRDRTVCIDCSSVGNEEGASMIAIPPTTRPSPAERIYAGPTSAA